MTQSTAMQELAARLQYVIRNRSSVLLCGEPGTDLEQFARAIHLATDDEHGTPLERLLRQSMKAGTNGRPFVIVDCADRDDLEARLFAVRSAPRDCTPDHLERVGEGSALHRALGGSLFLPRLPDMPAGLQYRLARVLRDEEAWLEQPNGHAGHARVVVRAIATSPGMADGGRLVPALKERLADATLEVPPLRHRREDVPGLVLYLLEDICADLHVSLKTASGQAMELLSALPWRRNVDELRGFLTTLVQAVPNRVIRQADVLAHVRLDGTPRFECYSGTLRQARGQFERDYVAAVLRQHHGRMAEAAKALGIQRTNLYRKIRTLALKLHSSCTRS